MYFTHHILVNILRHYTLISCLDKTFHTSYKGKVRYRGNLKFQNIFKVVVESSGSLKIQSNSIDIFEFDSRYILRYSAVDIFHQQTKSQWYKNGVNLIKENLQPEIINKEAKGVILFIGDGMSITKVTAARILDGQTKGVLGRKLVDLTGD